MALLAFANADLHAVSGAGALQWWDIQYSGGVIEAATGFDGTNAYRVQTTNPGLGKRLLPGDNTVICGCYWRISELNANIIKIRGSGAGSGGIHVTLYVNSAGILEFRRGTGTILASGTPSSGAIIAGLFYYIEFKCTISNTGSFEVRVEGETIMSEPSIDTQNGGGANYFEVTLVEVANITETHRFDHFYICDGTGGVEDDFLGPHLVDNFLASGPGNASEFTAVPAVSNELNVDDNPPDDDTSYNHSDVIGDQDLYDIDISSLPAGNTIVAGSLEFMIRKSNLQGRSCKTLVRAGGTTYDQGTHAVTSEVYTRHSKASIADEILRVNPDTGVAWTRTDVFEIGVEVA